MVCPQKSCWKAKTSSAVFHFLVRQWVVLFHCILWPHDTTADSNNGLNGLGKEISKTVSPNELLLFVTWSSGGVCYSHGKIVQFWNVKGSVKPEASRWALLRPSFSLALQSKNASLLPFSWQHKSELCMGKPLGNSWAVEEWLITQVAHRFSHTHINQQMLSTRVFLVLGAF